jgi:hypothetical protein
MRTRAPLRISISINPFSREVASDGAEEVPAVSDINCTGTKPALAFMV